MGQRSGPGRGAAAGGCVQGAAELWAVSAPVGALCSGARHAVPIPDPFRRAPSMTGPSASWRAGSYAAPGQVTPTSVPCSGDTPTASQAGPTRPSPRHCSSPVVPGCPGHLLKQFAGTRFRGESEQKPGRGCGRGVSGTQVALSLSCMTPQTDSPTAEPSSSCAHASYEAKAVRQGSWMPVRTRPPWRASSATSMKSVPSGSLIGPCCRRTSNSGSKSSQ
mmetsp:Transcript_21932/g.52407  ORF Transcript_21932/g.52407 Transcript_21932/m.52407 type:complete len:220 (+) Transcript_21932:379-1038(+)